MSYILNIESSTDICSVALSFDDKLIAIVEEKNTMKHSEIIAILIEEVLKKSDKSYSDLSAVSISEGPGSYTSLRVGTSAAKAICYAMNIPLISVNTLYSLACPLKKTKESDYFIFSMIDARRNEVYGSLYYQSLIAIFENKPIVLDQFDFNPYLDLEKKIFLTGNGAKKVKLNIENKNIIETDILCSAQNLIKPAFFKFINNDFTDMAYFSPNYIKPPNITIPNVN